MLMCSGQSLAPAAHPTARDFLLRQACPVQLGVERAGAWDVLRDQKAEIILATELMNRGDIWKISHEPERGLCETGAGAAASANMPCGSTF